MKGILKNVHAIWWMTRAQGWSRRKIVVFIARAFFTSEPYLYWWKDK